MILPVRMVYAEWLDICGGNRTGWRPLGNMAPKPVLCKAYGELRIETPEAIVIVPHISLVDGEILGDGEICIPRGTLRCIVELVAKPAEGGQ